MPVYPDLDAVQDKNCIQQLVKTTSLKRFSAVPVLLGLIGVSGSELWAQDTSRVNQDELASFYGRMNVVVGSGARAFGMGGAFLARADDATAASWNPAGLSYLRRTEFSLVGGYNDFSQQVPREVRANLGDPPSPVTTTDRLRGSVADFVGFAYPFRIQGRAAAIQASYQRSFSFTGSRRSEGPVGVKGFVQAAPGIPEYCASIKFASPWCAPPTILPTDFTVEGNGGFDTVSVSSGVEIHPRVRLGLSLNSWFNGFSQVVNRPDARTGGYRRISSTWDISGANYNLGALIAATSKLNLGLVYKTPFAADVRLSKVREDLLVAIDGDTGLKAEPEFVRYQGDVQIRFPRVYGLGASYRVTNTLTVSADFTRTAWSQATITDFFSLARRPTAEGESPVDPVDRYDERPFPAIEVPSAPEGIYRQVDTGQVRLGAEWVLRLGSSGNLFLPLRAGFFRDSQPVLVRLQEKDAAPGFPVPETQPVFSGFTAGFGVTVGGVLFDVAYIREQGDVIASRSADGLFDENDLGRFRQIRYNRVFASMMIRFGHRR